MLTNRWYRKLPLLLILVLAFSGASMSAAFAGDSFARKVAVLQDELRGYDSLKRPGARQKACARIGDALLAVLNDKKSLAIDPRGLIGDGGAFTLTFGSWVAMGGRDHRLVFLAPRQAAPGATTAIFSQAGGGAASAAPLHTLTQGDDAVLLEHAAIIMSAAGSYLVLAEKRRGPERSCLAFYSWRLTDGKWQPFLLPPDGAAPGRWTIETTGRGFTVSHAAVGRRSPYDYRLNTADWGFAVQIAAKDARPLAAIRLDLDDGRWIIQQ